MLYRTSYWTHLGEEWPAEVLEACNVRSDCAAAVTSLSEAHGQCVTSAIGFAAQTSQEWQASLHSPAQGA